MTSLRFSAVALVVFASGTPVRGQDAPRSGVAAWDTGTAAPDRIGPEALAKHPDGWKRLDAAATPGGDLVVTNGRLMGVARRKGLGLELYSLGTGTPVYRFRLGVPGRALERASLTEIGRGGAALELAWSGASVRFRLGKG